MIGFSQSPPEESTCALSPRRLAAALALGAVLLSGCGAAGDGPGAASAPPLDSTLFTHHYVSRDLPGDKGWGYGLVPPADLDGDGDVDYGVYARNDSVYWFENRGVDHWVRHSAGALPTRGLGGAVHDVNGDGYPDILLAGLWYQNPGNPTEAAFERHTFDDRIDSEIHDMILADIDGDGRDDLVSLGDGEGVFWYSIPDDPTRDENWPRTTVTMSVLDENDDIHSGFFPQGIGDLDGDGDPDPDIVSLEADGTGSGGAWLENDGGDPPSFSVHELPTTHPGTRGSFHSLAVGDFDGDGDPDIFTVEQEDTSIFPKGAPPRWFIWENDGGNPPTFTERVIFDGRLGGHDALAADVDGDGDLDILSKAWNVWDGNANGGTEHVDVLENRLR